MPVLTPEQIYSVARQAGFNPDQAVTWTAIAMAESGGNSEAHAGVGEDSWGLWQINVGPGVRPNTFGDLTDPLVNAKAAFQISGQGTNIQPWSVTHANNAGTSRDYRMYLDEAQAAAAAGGDASALTLGGSGMNGEGDDDGGGGTINASHVQPVSDAELVDTWHAPRSGGRQHMGIDIMADEGTDIHAVTSGTIVRDFEGGPLGGTVVRLEGDDGRYYYFAHLVEGSTDHLTVGQHVEVGDVIGQVGDTGNAAGGAPHLHFQVMENGEWVNPYDFLQGLPDAEDAMDGDDGDDDDEGEDADDDDLDDAFEIAVGTDPTLADTDHDGLLDGLEALSGIDPTQLDTDQDGIGDAFEIVRLGTNPLLADTDLDGKSDSMEYAIGEDPLLGPDGRVARYTVPGASPEAPTVPDQDRDGMTDRFEAETGTDPMEADTDQDALNDDLEVAMGSNPLMADTDHDGLTDGFESQMGTDIGLMSDGLSDGLGSGAGPGGGEEYVDDGHDHGDGLTDDDLGPVDDNDPVLN